MRVLFVTPCFYPAVQYGGPPVTMFQLAKALHARGVEVHVATTNADGARDLSVPLGREVDVEGLKVTYFGRLSKLDYAFAPGLKAHVARVASSFDVIHVWSTFSYASWVGASAARAAKVPYLVSPLGSLTGDIFRAKRWKKVPYWHLIERRTVAGASAVHVMSAMEGDKARQAMSHPLMPVIPTGIDLPASPSAVARSPSRLLFLGRLHVGKGFDVMIPALRLIAKEMPHVETHIAGLDEAGGRAAIEALAAAEAPRPNLRFVGAVFGEKKDAFLAGGAALLLPSKSESFGMVVLEALAQGTPVITSDKTPWSSLVGSGAGAWIERTQEAFANEALAILRDPEGASARSEACRAFARRYSWDASASAMIALYERLKRRDNVV